MDTQDTRWVRRFHTFSKALGQLRKFIDKGPLNELEEQGLIQAFEYTYELAWNTLKDYFEVQGETNITGSRDAIRLAFRRGLVKDGETWIAMVRSRTLTSHTYDEGIAREIAGAIVSRYFPAFVAFETTMEAIVGKDE